MVDEKKYGYTVDISDSLQDSYFEGVQFGEWSESWDHTFLRVYKTPENAYSSVSSHLNIPAGTPVYVVWVEYSEGDSFGWADRRGTEVIAILTEKEDATGLEDYLEKQRYYGDSNYKGNYTLKDGTTIEFYQSWSGYFERLDSVHVETTLLNIRGK